MSRLKIDDLCAGTLKRTLALESAVPLSWTTVSSSAGDEADELVDMMLLPLTVKLAVWKIPAASDGTENPVIARIAKSPPAPSPEEISPMVKSPAVALVTAMVRRIMARELEIGAGCFGPRR